MLVVSTSISTMMMMNLMQVIGECVSRQSGAYVPICQQDVPCLSKTFAYAEVSPTRYVHTFAVLTPTSARRARTGPMAGHRRWSPIPTSVAAIESTRLAITYKNMHIFLYRCRFMTPEVVCCVLEVNRGRGAASTGVIDKSRVGHRPRSITSTPRLCRRRGHLG